MVLVVCVGGSGGCPEPALARADRFALSEQSFALPLVETTPDTVLLPDVQGIGKTVVFHSTGRADRLGSLLSLELLVLPLEMRRREEDNGLRPPARSPDLPGLVS